MISAQYQALLDYLQILEFGNHSKISHIPHKQHYIIYLRAKTFWPYC